MRSFSNNPIVNIVRAELVTTETTPRVLFFDTVRSAVPEPFVSEGEENELRVRNTILAQDCLEDIIKGYNITLKDCVLSKELLAVIDGGETVASSSGAFAGYRSPQAGSEANRVRFSLRLYAAEKDYGGDCVSFFRFSFPNCCGTPAKFSFEEGSFVTPEYLVRSRPVVGSRAMTVECLDKLPQYCASSGDLPEDPDEGSCIIATGALTVDEQNLAVGDMAYFNGSTYVKIS